MTSSTATDTPAPRPAPVIDCSAVKCAIANFTLSDTDPDGTTASVRSLLLDAMAAVDADMDSAIASVQQRITAFKSRGLPASPVVVLEGRALVVSDLPHPHKALLLDIVAIANDVDALRRSVVMSALAVIDAIRRHDKALPSSLTSEMLTALGSQRWYTSTALGGLVEAICSLTTATLPSIAAPERTPPAPHDACGVCLGDLRSAVRLPCAHRFCWNCFLGARAHSLSKCPNCRAEQPMDLNEYELDPVLSTTLEALLGAESAAAVLKEAKNVPPGVTFQGRSRVSFDGLDIDGAHSPNTWARSAATTVLAHAPALHSRPSPSLNPLAREFSPSLGFTLPPAPSPTSSPLSASAKEFVPTTALDIGASAGGFAKGPRRLSQRDAVPLRPGVAIESILSMASEKPPPRAKGVMVRYSIAELLAMRPLNPNANEFVPYEATWGAAEGGGWEEKAPEEEEEDGFSVWVNKRSSRHRKAKKEKEAPRADEGWTEVRKTGKRAVFRDTARRPSQNRGPRVPCA